MVVGYVFECFVVEVYVSGDESVVGNVVQIYSVVVVLVGDFYIVGEQVFDWLVVVLVFEFYFEGLFVCCEVQNLVVQVDVEGGEQFYYFLGSFVGVFQWGGVVGVVVEEQVVWLQCYDLCWGGVCWDYDGFDVDFGQLFDDGVFDVEIYQYYVFVLVQCREGVGQCGGDFFGYIKFVDVLMVMCLLYVDLFFGGGEFVVGVFGVGEVVVGNYVFDYII